MMSMKDKGEWGKEEDEFITEYIRVNGAKRWNDMAICLNQTIPSAARTGKQCRERWMSHLNQTSTKGAWEAWEDKIIWDEHNALGNKWKHIASMLPGRSEAAVKNRWYSVLSKQTELKPRLRPQSYLEDSDNSEEEGSENYKFFGKNYKSAKTEYNAICKETGKDAEDFSINASNGQCQVVGNPFVRFISTISMTGNRGSDLSSSFVPDDVGYGGREENTYFCFSDIHHTNFDGRRKCDMVEAQRYYHKYWPHTGPFALNKGKK